MCNFGLSEKEAIAHLKYYKKNCKQEEMMIPETRQEKGFGDFVIDKIDGFINVLIDMFKA